MDAITHNDVPCNHAIAHFNRFGSLALRKVISKHHIDTVKIELIGRLELLRQCLASLSHSTKPFIGTKNHKPISTAVEEVLRVDAPALVTLMNPFSMRFKDRRRDLANLPSLSFPGLFSLCLNETVLRNVGAVLSVNEVHVVPDYGIMSKIRPHEMFFSFQLDSNLPDKDWRRKDAILRASICGADWKQDIASYPFDSRKNRYLIACAPLVNSTSSNGSFKVASGSHRYGMRACPTADEARSAVVVDLSAGDVLLFHPHLFYRSSLNMEVEEGFSAVFFRFIGITQKETPPLIPHVLASGANVDPGLDLPEFVSEQSNQMRRIFALGDKRYPRKWSFLGGIDMVTKVVNRTLRREC